MFGSNPRRAPETGDGRILRMQEIFPTLQGEGPFTGMPAVFLRLAGCNLACSFCDTAFDDDRLMTLPEILAETEVACDIPRPLAVITGGEPLRQPIAPLCSMLLERGYKVQIETNGTLYQPLPDGVHIVCSPKAQDGAYLLPHAQLLPHIDAFKFLISTRLKPYDTVPAMADGTKAAVYLQPLDLLDETENRQNLEHAMMLAETGGYLLSVQTHKLFAID